jgi:hypothetical protein
MYMTCVVLLLLLFSMHRERELEGQSTEMFVLWQKL